jgi:hypothetical protein
MEDTTDAYRTPSSSEPRAANDSGSVCFFRDLTEKQLRRGAFTSVDALEAAILTYIDQHNRSPKPFIWTDKASDIMEKVKRAKSTLYNSPSV